MKKGLLAGVLVAWTSLAGAHPATAKMPPFSVDVQVSDMTAVVTLRIDEGTGYDPGVTLENLIGIFPAADVDDRGRPVSRDGMLLVTVHPSFEPLVYIGTVELPGSGDYVAIPFPEVIGDSLPPVEMYGGPVHFSIGGDVASGPAPSPLVVGGAALLAVVTAAAWLGARSRSPVATALLES